MRNDRKAVDPDLEALLQERTRNRWLMAVTLLVFAAIVCGLLVFVRYELSDSREFTLGAAALKTEPARKETVTVEVMGNPTDRYYDHTLSPKRSVRQTVALETTIGDELGRTTKGTGFILTSGIIVTTAHLLRLVPKSELHPLWVACNGGVTQGTVALFDPLREVAIVTAPVCTGGDLTLREDAPAPFETLSVAVVHYENGAAPEWRDQKVSALPPAQPPVVDEPTYAAKLFNLVVKDMRSAGIGPLLPVDGQFEPGNSGGLVTDEREQVVGMLMGTTSAGNFTVPTPTIIQAMKEGGMLP